MKKRNLAILVLAAMCTMVGCGSLDGGTLLSSDESSKKTENVDKNGDASTGNMRTDFKNAMDSYEDFIDSYCEFMKRYANSDGADVNMMTEYTEYMTKYSQAVKDFEAWDNGEMNDVETAYYIEVQARVSKKLLEVSN